jgi:hypothetical protein
MSLSSATALGRSKWFRTCDLARSPRTSSPTSSLSPWSLIGSKSFAPIPYVTRPIPAFGLLSFAVVLAVVVLAGLPPAALRAGVRLAATLT